MIVSSIQGAETAPVVPVAQPVAAASAAPARASNLYYYSPMLTLDPSTRAVVLQVRDANTGEVTAQYPSKKDLDAYAQHTADKPAAKQQAAAFVKAVDDKTGSAAKADDATTSKSTSQGGRSVIV